MSSERSFGSNSSTEMERLETVVLDVTRYLGGRYRCVPVHSVYRKVSVRFDTSPLPEAVFGQLLDSMKQRGIIDLHKHKDTEMVVMKKKDLKRKKQGKTKRSRSKTTKKRRLNDSRSSSDSDNPSLKIKIKIEDKSPDNAGCKSDPTNVVTQTPAQIKNEGSSCNYQTQQGTGGQNETQRKNDINGTYQGVAQVPETNRQDDQNTSSCQRGQTQNNADQGTCGNNSSWQRGQNQNNADQGTCGNNSSWQRGQNQNNTDQGTCGNNSSWQKGQNQNNADQGTCGNNSSCQREQNQNNANQGTSNTCNPNGALPNCCCPSGQRVKSEKCDVKGSGDANTIIGNTCHNNVDNKTNGPGTSYKQQGTSENKNDLYYGNANQNPPRDQNQGQRMGRWPGPCTNRNNRNGN